MSTSPTSQVHLVATPEVQAFRDQFPIFEHKTHLASNSKGALSQAAIAAYDEYLTSWRELGAPWDVWVGKHEQLRVSFAEMIGAAPHEVAVCPSLSSAFGAVTSALDWRERPGVALDDFCFPTVAYLWHAQAARGAEVRRVPPNAADELPPEAFLDAVDERCQLVSVAHVCYRNGHRLDLAPVAQIAHDAGALFVVDDYQCCGSRPLDVRSVGIDVLATGTVKFLLGSPGVALLYVREGLLERLHPTMTGWFGQRDPGDFQIDGHFEAPDASRFQSGTPAIPAIYDSLAGIELIKSVGLDEIGAWVDGLTAHLVERLDAAGFVPATPRDPRRRGPQVAIRTHDMGRAVAELARRGVIVSSRDGNLRAAFHYYNVPEDIDALIGALDEIRPLMVTRDA